MEPRKRFGDFYRGLVFGINTPRYSTLTVGMEGLSHIRDCEEILAPSQKKGNSPLWWGWINVWLAKARHAGTEA
jgi:hypothetical protein